MEEGTLYIGRSDFEGKMSEGRKGRAEELPRVLTIVKTIP